MRCVVLALVLACALALVPADEKAIDGKWADSLSAKELADAEQVDATESFRERLVHAKESMTGDRKLEAILASSLVNQGAGVQWTNFMTKLLTRQPVTVMTVGGSVTCGNGLTEADRKWSDNLRVFLNRTFPTPPGRLHKVINICYAGKGTCDFMKQVRMAINTNLGAGVVPDLTILEFGVNDYWSSDAGAMRDIRVPAARTLANCLEATVRTLLGLNSAVMMLEITGARFGVYTAEGAHRRVASYYGLPVVSEHLAIRPNVDRALSFGCAGRPCPDDRLHGDPGDTLHDPFPRCQGCELVTCRKAAADGMFFGLQGVDDVHSNCLGHLLFSKMLEWALLSSAIHFRNSTDGGIPECCISAVTPSEKTRMKSWSKWYMFAGARSDGYNEEGCLHLMNSAGYDIVNVDGSQRDPDTFIYHNTSAGWQCNDKDHSKWGWLSPQNGLAAPLGITIRLPPAKLQYEIYLTYLRSYVNMSAFEVTAWCSGQEDKKTMTQLRGQWETQVSISQFDKIVTTTSEGGEQLCHVKIAATEPGKKIKVLAVSATLK